MSGGADHLARAASSRSKAEGATKGVVLDLAGVRASARPSGALWLPERRALIVSDLHLGKSERLARAGGPFLPPYEGLETLMRLEAEISALRPAKVVSLGDAFDDARAAFELDETLREALLRLMAGRRWIWVLGNHDPSPPSFGGEGRSSVRIDALELIHEARAAGPTAGRVEISGHFHPKARVVARGRRLSRRCFLWDGRRLILPAFGAYTGGLSAADGVFARLLSSEAQALLLTDGAVRALPLSACC